MDQDFQQPNTQPPVGDQPTPAVTPPVTQQPPNASFVAPAPVAASGFGEPSEPRNFLVTFLLTLSGGILGLRNFYIGQKKIGWIRLGMFIGIFVSVLLAVALKMGAFVLIAFLLEVVAGIWAIVDFFLVYFSVRTDADGAPLTMTKRDHKWATVIFWVNIAAFAFVLIVTLVGYTYAESKFKSLTNSNTSNSNYLNTTSGQEDFFNSDSSSSL